MEQLILDQIMKLSHQMGEMHAELCAKIDAQDKKIDAQRQYMDAKFKEQDEKFETLINEQGKKIDAQGKRMDAGFKAQDEKIETLIAENTARLEKIIKEEAKGTAEIFHDIFRKLGENERKIVSLYK